MTDPANWIDALTGSGRAAARILFARLGLVARCRALSSEEIAEAIQMGGEKGARYTIYLSCGGLSEAGEQLRLRGEILSPFDITRGIPYADAIVAAGMIVRLSGGSEAMVRMLGDEESDDEAIFRGMDGESVSSANEEAKGNPFAASFSASADIAGQRAQNSSFFNAPGQGHSLDSGIGMHYRVEDDFMEVYASRAAAADSGGEVYPRIEALEAVEIGGAGHLPNAGASLDSGSRRAANLGAGGVGLDALTGGRPAVDTAFRGGFAAMGDDTDRFARLLADRLTDAAGNI